MTAAKASDVPSRVQQVLDSLPDAHPSGDGWAARCPAHGDGSPSLVVSVGEDGYRPVVWCHGGCDYADVRAALIGRGVPETALRPAGPGQRPSTPTQRPTPVPTPATPQPTTQAVDPDWLERCEWALSDERLAKLVAERPGLDAGSLIQAGLGWDSERQRYVLPVHDPTTGEVVDYCRSKWQADKKRHAWWQPTGGTARLYAPGGLGSGRVLLCEGEWDTLLAWQHGYNAVGTTGGAGTVPAVELLEPLRGRDVFVAFDCDDAGRDGAEKWARRLAGMGCRVRVVDLGLPDKGADISDLLTQRSAGSLRDLMDAAPTWAGQPDEVPENAGGIKPVDWDEFWSTEPTPIRYLVDPLIAAGEVTRVFAQAKVGKSLLIMECAAGLATGRGALGHATCERVPVVYVDQENTADDWKTRLGDMGYGPDDDWSDLHWFSFQAWPPLDTKAGAAVLLATVEKHAARLVVLDTQSKFLDGEEDKATTGAAFYRHTLLPLKRLGVAVVVIDHAGNDAAKPRGSSTKRDDVDTVWRAEKVGSDSLRLTRMLSRKRHEVGQLALVRRLDPLRHEPEGAGGIASAKKVAECIEAIQALDPIPTAQTSGAQVIKRLREAGRGFREKDVRAAWNEMREQLRSGQ